MKLMCLREFNIIFRTLNVPNSDVSEKCTNMCLIGYYFIKRVLRFYFSQDSPDMELLFSIVEETVRVVSK